MPKKLQTSLQEYLSKLKRETGKIPLSASSFSSSKKWVLAKCKNPKTLSFSINRKNSSKSKSRDDDENGRGSGSGHAATLSDIDRFLEENFKSLYIREDDDDDHDDRRRRRDRDRYDVDADSERYPEKKDKNKNKKKKKIEESEDDDEDDDSDKESRRFKRAWERASYDSPKLSDPRRWRQPRSMAATTSTTKTSMSEDMPWSSNTSSLGYGRGGGRTGAALPEDCIAVLRYTPDPLEDFRRSMLEMVEARLGLRGPEVEWDFVEELLFCYLDLNNRKSHAFILSAFVDLIIVLRGKDKDDDVKSISKSGLIRSLSTHLATDRIKRRVKKG